MNVLTVTLNPCIDRTVKVSGFSNIEKKIREDAGGKGINVARVLSKSGIKCICTGIMPKVGSEIIYKTLESDGIEYDFAETEGNLRVNIKMVDDKTGETTEKNEKGFVKDKKAVSEFMYIYEKYLSESGVVVLSGSVAEGINKDIYKTLIEKAKKADKKVILDSSGDFFRIGIKALPTVIKPNLSEFENLIGYEITNESKLKNAVMELYALGIEIVAVSMGADGAVFSKGGKLIKTKPFAADIKNTVGAGDSMVAAIAYSMLKGYDLIHLSRLATSAGTLTATFDGTDFCSLKIAEGFMDKIEIINTNK